MAPTELERLATLEVKAESTEKLMLEIKTELRRLPHRIGKNTMRQLEQCRQMQDGKHAKTATATVQKPDDDYGWLKKLLIISMTIGTLIGGAIYQVTQESKGARPQISQGDNK